MIDERRSVVEQLGPGVWIRNVSHQTVPFCHYFTDFLTRRDVARGFTESYGRFGILQDKSLFAYPDGWFYILISPPVSDGVFEQRLVAAENAVAARLWDKDADAFFATGREALMQRMRVLQAVDLAGLDDEAVLRHVGAAGDALELGFYEHFLNVGAHMIGVGDWLMNVAAWTGAATEEAMRPLSGQSSHSIDDAGQLREIANAIKKSDAARAVLGSSDDAQIKLAKLRAASQEIATVIDTYLAEYGGRILSGWDLTDITAGEAPATLLMSIEAQMRNAAPSAPDDTLQSLRERVPAVHGDEFDALFEAAAKAYRLRDADTGPSSTWPVGMLRLAVLEIGRRLASRGLIAQPEQVFNAEMAEAESLLLTGAGPSASDLTRRGEERAAQMLNPPPRMIGFVPGPPPSFDTLPPALRRINAATFMAMSALQGGPIAPANADGGAANVLKGTGASKGVAEGTARLVLGPADFDRLQPADILVAAFTTPVYNVVLPIIGGIVTDHGGLLSHAAIVAREYGLPAVVATGVATSTIRDGARVRVDGTSGVVTVLD